MSKLKRNLSQKELVSAIGKLNRELAILREVKSLLYREGIKPDLADKHKESKLIQRLIGYEKDLKRLQQGPVEAKPSAPVKFAKSKLKQSFRK